MSGIRRRFMLLSLAFLLPLAQAIGGDDAEIKQQIIRQSIAATPGSCPCPYSKDRAGRTCGRKSAYNKPNGERPLCYPGDVTPEMMQRHRARRS